MSTLPKIRALTDAAEVSVSDLRNGGDLPPELRPKAAPRRAQRSEVQIAIDARVAEVYQQWKDQGCEAVWLRCPLAFYAVPPAKRRDMHDKIRKAGRLHKVQIQFGRDDLLDDQGNALVVFTVKDPSTKELELLLCPSRFFAA